MKIFVLGATGPTGVEIVRQAIASRYDVVALVRSPSKATRLSGARLVEGDARDEATLAKAMTGCDAVVSALGTPMSPFREVTLLSTATRALVRAMQTTGVKRLVCITGLGAGDSRGHGGFVFDSIILPFLLRKVYEDKDRQEAAIRDSPLDWIIVRPVVLDDKPGTGRIRALTDLSGIHGGTISRRDVARFVLEQIESDAWLHRAPLVIG